MLMCFLLHCYQFFDYSNKNDLEANLKVLEPENICNDFDSASNKFSESMDLILPSPKAKPYALSHLFSKRFNTKLVFLLEKVCWTVQVFIELIKQMISSKQIYNILRKTNGYRNDWKGHGGVESSTEAN